MKWKDFRLSDYFEPFTLRELGEGLMHLFWPNLCAACGEDVPADGSCFCLPCRVKLSSTKDMHLQVENEFTRRLWGRVRIESATALYYFVKASPIQRALHQLKYHDQPAIGIRLGEELGRKLRKSELFKNIDYIVPIPLHPTKEWKRGYNQSAKFGEGIADEMGVPMLTDLLIRSAHAASQTTKKRADRYQNVGSVYAVKKPQRATGKHILLIDDVMTTGATLETCGNLLHEAIPNLRLSLATIAIATNRII